eukprot:747249-Hanusia_phi.AAC.3
MEDVDDVDTRGGGNDKLEEGRKQIGGEWTFGLGGGRKKRNQGNRRRGGNEGKEEARGGGDGG